jgi:sensor histidine kinase YesM
MIEPFYVRYRTLLLHISFWVLYAVYRFFDFLDFGGADTWVYVLLPLSFYITTCYIHYFLVLPLWIQKKKVWLYILCVVVLIVVNAFSKVVVEMKVYSALKPDFEFFQSIHTMSIVTGMWNTASFLLFTGMLRFTIDRFDLENKRKQLENEKLVAELNYLKAQINPHFLFNTLHNLNYLVYSGSKNATDVIIKLSNIMRYMIYEASKEKVQLVHELNYIRDYIHLESIRLNNAFKLTFEVDGNVQQIEISPLIFITLVENAFKHGVRDSVSDCWVKINLLVSDSVISFWVENKKLPVTTLEQPSGFGLENLRKRLSLTYPESHLLTIKETDTTYRINVTLTRT